MIYTRKQPYWWSAAHSPVIYEYDYWAYGLTATVSVSGKLGVVSNDTYLETPEAGMYVYIGAGANKGLHRISEYLGIIITESDYLGYQDTGNFKLITEHTFKLYSGFQAGEPFAAQLPYTLIAEFKPEVSADGFLRFNISGYLKSLFNPDNYLNPTTYGVLNYYTGLFNRYRLVLSGSVQSNRMVLNSALSQVGLQSYTNGLQPLTAQFPALTFECDTPLVYLNDTGAYLTLPDTGVDFDPVDFNNSDFVTG